MHVLLLGWELFKGLNLVGVLIACGLNYSKLRIIYVEYHTVLPHECASEKNFIGPLEFLYCKAVLGRFIPEKVFTWIPI